MAERRPARGDGETKQADRAPRSNRTPRDNGTDRSRLTAAEAGRDALRQLVDLTGKEPEGVSGVEPSDDGWIVMVDMVEDRRIPSTSDILATYEVELALDGELISYRRVRRYMRGRVDDGTG
jgi:hypothetical protein